MQRVPVDDGCDDDWDMPAMEDPQRNFRAKERRARLQRASGGSVKPEGRFTELASAAGERTHYELTGHAPPARSGPQQAGAHAAQRHEWVAPQLFGGTAARLSERNVQGAETTAPQAATAGPVQVSTHAALCMR